MEYKWTKQEIPVTTHNIIVDKPSKQKPQLTTNKSVSIQGNKVILQTEPITKVSYRPNNDKKKDKPIDNVDKKQLPFVPINLPNPIHEIKLKNGKIKIHKYIN